MTKPKDFLTIKEIMDQCDVSYKTVFNWFHQGLPSYKIGKHRRINPEDLDKFISRKKQNILI